jgi:hypothetical protein
MPCISLKRMHGCGSASKIPVLVIGLLVFYVLSIGPAGPVLDSVDSDGLWLLYRPVQYLTEENEPFRLFLIWWCNLWGWGIAPDEPDESSDAWQVILTHSCPSTSAANAT